MKEVLDVARHQTVSPHKKEALMNGLIRSAL